MEGQTPTLLNNPLYFYSRGHISQNRRLRWDRRWAKRKENDPCPEKEERRGQSSLDIFRSWWQEKVPISCAPHLPFCLTVHQFLEPESSSGNIYTVQIKKQTQRGRMCGLRSQRKWLLKLGLEPAYYLICSSEPPALLWRTLGVLHS